MKSYAAIVLKPRLMKDGERVFGPGKADLLEFIGETGSISAAARKLEMSYSRAWALVDTMNHAFKTPLVEAALTLGVPIEKAATELPEAVVPVRTPASDTELK